MYKVKLCRCVNGKTQKLVAYSFEVVVLMHVLNLLKQGCFRQIIVAFYLHREKVFKKQLLHSVSLRHVGRLLARLFRASHRLVNIIDLKHILLLDCFNLKPERRLRRTSHRICI